MARLLIATVFAIIAVTVIAQSPASAPSNSPLPAVSVPPTATATPPTAAAPTTATPPTATSPTTATPPTIAGEGPSAVADGPAAGESPSGSPTGSPSNGAVSLNRVAVAGGSFVAVALVSALVF
ncbi:hypothetical protein RND81_02G095900 [Saponaria officinalis]|uniref:Arabinogalactan-protein n=1 Tax=Saponaria officinalis TaxID=3572 RepID=A0AAW1MTK2_SAPOF